MTANENYHITKLSQSLNGKPVFSHLWVLDPYRHKTHTSVPSIKVAVKRAKRMKELERETKEAGSEAFGEHSQMRLYTCVKMALWTSKYIDVN